MKLEIKEPYRCGQCREIHDDEDGALECCQPAVITIYLCPICEEKHDEYESAAKCCGVDSIKCPSCYRDHSSVSLDYQAITISGHCCTCNPIFTVEQQFAIQDMHYQHTGKRQHLHD